MKLYDVKKTIRKRCKKWITITALILILLLSMAMLPFTGASAAPRSETPQVRSSTCCDGGDCCIINDCVCPQCWDRGDPGGICDKCGGDLCDNCGNCYNCGRSPCPVCRTDDNDLCPGCGGMLCETCGGCLECGEGRDPDCPDCGDIPRSKVIAYSQDDGSSGLPINNDLIPLFMINGTPVYLFAPWGTPSWAILSLLLTVLGVIISTFITTRAIIQKKNENASIAGFTGLDLNDDGMKKKKFPGSFFNSGILSSYNGLFSVEKSKNERRKLTYLGTQIVLVIFTIILILLVQDFRGIIVLFDWWVLIHSALFGAIVYCGVKVPGKHRKQIKHKIPVLSKT